jgi:hypothetical protein
MMLSSPSLGAPSNVLFCNVNAGTSTCHHEKVEIKRATHWWNKSLFLVMHNMVIRSSANSIYVVSSFSAFRMVDLRHRIWFWQYKESEQENSILANHMFRLLFGADAADPCQSMATPSTFCGGLIHSGRLFPGLALGNTREYNRLFVHLT